MPSSFSAAVSTRLTRLKTSPPYGPPQSVTVTAATVLALRG
ncbi:hypothetical protein M2168_004751 [Streptomyces sp. CZ24]|nr:hypothetical protein [Streptomyces sp. CZ24]MDH6191719.1 hypothetical protein [Streptomyces sp. CZ24]